MEICTKVAALAQTGSQMLGSNPHYVKYILLLRNLLLISKGMLVSWPSGFGGRGYQGLQKTSLTNHLAKQTHRPTFERLGRFGFRLTKQASTSASGGLLFMFLILFFFLRHPGGSWGFLAPPSGDPMLPGRSSKTKTARNHYDRSAR
jgi:hypothetical protein